MAKYEVVRSSAIFGIMIALFVSILVLMFTVAPEVREELLPPYVVTYENTIFEVFPGELIAGEVDEGVKVISLEDITVDNTLQHKELDVVRDAVFSSSIFTQEVYDFAFSIDTAKVRSAGLMFKIYDLSGDGDINVYVNGNKISSRSADLGDQIIVEFPKNYLRNGANTVEVTASTPSSKFWQKNSFTILDVVLFTEEYDENSAANQVFSLVSSEAVNANEAILTAYLIPIGERGNVDIWMNDARLLKATPPQNLELSIPTTSLKAGANVLKWYADKDVKYEVRFAKLNIDTVKTTGRATTYFFTITDEVYRRVSSDRYLCELALTRDSGDDGVIIELNAKQMTKVFVNDQLSVDICEDLKDDRNELKFLAADDELDLDKATLVIYNKDDGN